MSDPFLSLLHTAWQNLQPKIAADPDELNCRLARRRQGMMQRPPRAWCLVVRASDTRINPASALCVPEDAAWPTYAHEGVQPRHGRHEVTITAKLLRRICRPFYIPKPGLSVKELASQLGCSRQGLQWAVEHGQLPARHTRTGICGRSETIVYTDKPLDPSTPRCFEYADPLWETTWKYLGDHVPDDLEQTLVRVPRFRISPENKSGRGAGEHMRGWDWVCPGCERRVRVLYYPLDAQYGVRLLGREFPADHPDALPAPIRGFACTHCHNVLYVTRVNADAWNKLISHLSGGLLYGSDVPRPAWFKFERERDFRPYVNREPSKRRQQVLEELLNGLSYNQIASKFGVHKSTVNKHARTLYAQQRVKGPDALREKYGKGKGLSQSLLPLARRPGSEASPDFCLGSR